MNYNSRRSYSHRHGYNPRKFLLGKRAKRLFMDMVICPISPFSRPLVGRRNDLLAFAPEVFGHSLRRRSESYILFTIANLPSATFKKMGDSSSQGPPTIRSNPVVIVDLWLLNMGKLGPTIPVAALSTITKVIFRLSKDMVDQIREQPVK